MKKYLKWMVCLFSLIIFLILSYLVKTKSDIYLDDIIYSFISKFINNNLTHIIKFITFLGSASFVITLTLLALLFFKNKKIGIFISIDLIVITIFQYILKPIFGRSRPLDINLIEETSYSFPSGHSLTAMAFYGFIIYLIYKSNLKYKKVCIILLSILILLIGLSRVYLGVHFITDVLGGFTFSLFYLILFIELTKKYLK
jgi:undecaprenyl-diphosphatase